MDRTNHATPTRNSFVGSVFASAQNCADVCQLRPVSGASNVTVQTEFDVSDPRMAPTYHLEFGLEKHFDEDCSRCLMEQMTSGVDEIHKLERENRSLRDRLQQAQQDDDKPAPGLVRQQIHHAAQAELDKKYDYVGCVDSTQRARKQWEFAGTLSVDQTSLVDEAKRRCHSLPASDEFEYVSLECPNGNNEVEVWCIPDAGFEIADFENDRRCEGFGKHHHCVPPNRSRTTSEGVRLGGFHASSVFRLRDDDIAT